MSRFTAACLFLIMLALAAFASPATAARAAAPPGAERVADADVAFAAPALAIAPSSVPRGGSITVTGTGFAPKAPLALFASIPARNYARVELAALTAGADGGFTLTTRVPGFYQPGPFIVVAVSNGADLARASITVTTAPSIAPETLTVTPGAGPAGSRFTATGAGLTPGVAAVAFTTESAKGPTGHFRQVAAFQIPADGRVSFSFDTPGYTAQSYDVIIFGPGGPQIGFPLVVASFMVTAPGTTPGLPNTGGGGTWAAPAASWWGLAGGAIALVGLAGWSARRRRAA